MRTGRSATGACFGGAFVPEQLGKHLHHRMLTVQRKPVRTAQNETCERKKNIGAVTTLRSSRPETVPKPRTSSATTRMACTSVTHPPIQAVLVIADIMLANGRGRGPAR